MPHDSCPPELWKWDPPGEGIGNSDLEGLRVGSWVSKLSKGWKEGSSFWPLHFHLFLYRDPEHPQLQLPDSGRLVEANVDVVKWQDLVGSKLSTWMMEDFEPQTGWKCLAAGSHKDRLLFLQDCRLCRVVARCFSPSWTISIKMKMLHPLFACFGSLFVCDNLDLTLAPRIDSRLHVDCVQSLKLRACFGVPSWQPTSTPKQTYPMKMKHLYLSLNPARRFGFRRDCCYVLCSEGCKGPGGCPWWRHWRSGHQEDASKKLRASGQQHSN